MSIDLHRIQTLFSFSPAGTTDTSFFLIVSLPATSHSCNASVKQKRPFEFPFSSIISNQLLSNNLQRMSSENTPLVTESQAAMVASGTATLINESANKIKNAKKDGPLTFRTLGFIGGLAMIISNGLGVLDRFFSFNFTGSLIAIYGVIFGVLIVMLEMPSLWCLKSGRFNGGIRYYFKFLEYTAGRGAFFFFCGSLQVTNFNMLDWAVGGFMMFVGVTAIIAGIMAARDLRLFKFSIANEEDLKVKWQKYDGNGDGNLDIKELSVFIRESGVEMTRNEIASVYMALDKNFDDKLTYEEFYFWWMGEDQKPSGTPTLSV